MPLHNYNDLFLFFFRFFPYTYTHLQLKIMFIINHETNNHDEINTYLHKNYNEHYIIKHDTENSIVLLVRNMSTYKYIFHATDSSSFHRYKLFV